MDEMYEFILIFYMKYQINKNIKSYLKKEIGRINNIFIEDRLILLICPLFYIILEKHKGNFKIKKKGGEYFMDKLKYIKLENEDGSYSDSIPLAVDSDHVDVGGNTLTDELANKATADFVNNNVNNLNNKINGLASGSPLVANSITEMTDTSKTYVNTFDGNWYYYDGSSWQVGGVYQATKIEDSSITRYMLNNELKKSIYHLISTEIDKTLGKESQFLKDANSQVFAYGASSHSLVITIKPNTKYIVQKVQSERFALYTSISAPDTGVPITNYIQNNTKSELEISSGVDDNYLTILFYNSSLDSLTKNEIYNSLKIYEGEVQEGQNQADYLENLINSQTENLIRLINDNLIYMDKYINLVCEKHLGVLEKGYIAISCDDGADSLADDTIPLFLGYKATYNKDIPITMGLMSESPIFNLGNESKLATVSSFIESTGSSVAIHGPNAYTTYSIDELYNFLDTQKNYLTNNLAAPTSIIYPLHSYNKQTSVIAASYYGVCATGGAEKPITYNGESKLAGPRSNVYTLYRFSLFNEFTTNEKIKAAIDYAYEHNMIFMPFFHDITLHNDYARCKALLDYCVEYANNKGLEFINIGDIPTIK